MEAEGQDRWWNERRWNRTSLGVCIRNRGRVEVEEKEEGKERTKYSRARCIDRIHGLFFVRCIVQRTEECWSILGAVVMMKREPLRRPLLFVSNDCNSMLNVRSAGHLGI